MVLSFIKKKKKNGKLFVKKNGKDKKDNLILYRTIKDEKYLSRNKNILGWILSIFT